MSDKTEVKAPAKEKQMRVRYLGDSEYHSLEINVSCKGKTKGTVSESIAKQLIKDYPNDFEIIGEVKEEEGKEIVTSNPTREMKTNTDTKEKKIIRKKDKGL